MNKLNSINSVTEEEQKSLETEVYMVVPVDECSSRIEAFPVNELVCTLEKR